MRDRECSGFQIVDPRQHPNWNDLVRVHNGATVFHSREWAEVLCDSYDYRPSFLVRFRGTVLASVLPLIEVDSWVTGRRGISLPFSDECVPLGFQAGELQGAFDAAVELGQTRK